MSANQFLEIPKVESDAQNIGREANKDGDDVHTHSDTEIQPRSEREEALVALIEHRTREVHHLQQRICYYKSQV
ncbi:unnamed protein product [Cuscuta campestris]|uniref:Uncharacterized protein n=1 Tax=Cuscuta campestris TaxID=132261 RepID=A0A484L2X3_9ASTE|nr:unnamed protein product [Cuscuta campestris]